MRRGWLREAIDRHLEREDRRVIGHDTRGLTVRHLELSDDVRPRPYAGKKSRRTHARVWR
jgi:hypothetical protein